MKKEIKFISFILSIALVVAMVPAFTLDIHADVNTFVNSSDEGNSTTMGGVLFTPGGIVWCKESSLCQYNVSDELVLDLKGNVISGVSFYVESTGRLTITDSCSQTAVHYYHYHSATVWTLADLDSTDEQKKNAVTLGAVTKDTTEGTLVAVSGGAIYGGYKNSVGAGVYNAGVTTLSGINLIGNNTKVTNNGAGNVYNNSGSTVNIIGTRVIGNYTNGFGGGIYNNGGTCNIKSSIISYNIAYKYGGIYNTGTCDIEETTVSYNTANQDIGGGIYNVGTCNITGSTISYNTANSNGGGIYNDGGTCNITGSTISYNTANNNGGGIYNNNSGTCNIKESTISYNTANVGGGIYNNSSTCNITGSSICYNTATSNSNGGGGIFNTGNKAKCDIVGTNISYNTANKYGGGLYNSNSTCNITGSTISYNTANQYGGGIYNSNSSTCNITGSTISYNTANQYGGGIYNSNISTCNITGSTISYNTATYGGGICNVGTCNIKETTISYNTANNGGGIYNYIAGTCNIVGTIASNNVATSFGGVYYGNGNITLSDKVDITNNIESGSGINSDLIIYSGNLVSFYNFDYADSKIYITSVDGDGNAIPSVFTSYLSAADAAHYMAAFYSDLDDYEIVTQDSGGLATSYITEACIMDGTGYETVQEAVDAVNGSLQKTITMIKSVELTNVIEISTGKSVVLDLNGKTISATNCTAIENSGILTVMDSDDENTGKIYVERSNTSDATAIKNNQGAILTVTDAAVYAKQNNNEKSSVTLNNDGDLVIGGRSYVKAEAGLDTLAISNNNGGNLEVKGGTLTAVYGLQINSPLSNFSIATVSGVNTHLVLGDNNASLGSGAAVNFKNLAVLDGYFSGSLLNNVTLTVYGGKFTDDPSSYIAEGYYAYDLSSSDLPYLYGVKKDEVCLIGTTSYSSVTEALAAVPDTMEQTTITLLKNITEDVSVATNKSVTLDLNGYTLSNKNDEDVIKNNGYLTVVDSSNAKTGKIVIENKASREYSGINNKKGALLDFISGTIYSHGSENNTRFVAGVYNDGGVASFAGIIDINQTDTDDVYGINSSGNGYVVISGASITALANNSSSYGLNIGNKAKVLGNTTVTVSNPESNYAICSNVQQDVTVEDGKYVGLLTDGGLGGLEIYGGQYSDNPYAYLAEDYCAEDLASSYTPYKYEVKKEEVCLIGTTTYSSIAEALNAITDSDQKTITLLKNITVTSTVTIPAGRSVVLDLNGNTILFDCSVNNEVFSNYGNLAIDDSSSSHSGEIRIDGNYSDYGAGIFGIVNCENAILTLSAGSIFVRNTGIKSATAIQNYGFVSVTSDYVTVAAYANSSKAIGITNVGGCFDIQGGCIYANGGTGGSNALYSNPSAKASTISGINTKVETDSSGDNHYAVYNVVQNYKIIVTDGCFIGGIMNIIAYGGKYTTISAVCLATGFAVSNVSSAGSPYLYSVEESEPESYTASNVVYYNYNTCLKGYSCVLTRFNDVVNTAWYHDGLHYCVERGYMQGYDLVTFGPNDMLSRSMVVRMLWNVEGTSYTYASTTYTDAVAGSWYYSALAWAEACKVVDGYGDGTFGVSDNITREQFAKMLYTYAKYKGYDVSKTAELTYPDAKDVSSWAKDAVVWANAEGIIQGKDTGLLDPKGYASRAEAATMLMRLLTLK